VEPAPARRRYRRCGPVFLECGDRLFLDPVALLRGALEPQRLPLLRAYRPPQAGAVELPPLASACLAALSSGVARVLPDWLQSCPDIDAVLVLLRESGLIESVEEAAPSPSALVAPSLDDWFGPAALYHFASRWSDVLARDEVPVDASGAAQAFDASRAAFERQTQARGAPPAHFPERGDVAAAIELPRPAPTAFDTLLAARETHRLFDPAAALSLDALARLLRRCFGARAIAPLGGGLSALRKFVPSGGGMHPVEAYPLVANVQGLAPGWYHYRAGEHRLAPLRALTRDAAHAAITDATAGQAYFATAPLLVALTLRFPRHHWKYPQHARALRVMQLEVGHIGQTFYLAATEAGLGAFFTAAINDADLDAVLGLDGVEEGCVAVVGCGHPAPDGAALRLSHYASPD
jgi:putative peptide maturation dehydrogenase